MPAEKEQPKRIKTNVNPSSTTRSYNLKLLEESASGDDNFLVEMTTFFVVNSIIVIEEIEKYTYIATYEYGGLSLDHIILKSKYDSTITPFFCKQMFNGFLYLYADHSGWLAEFRRLPKAPLLKKIRSIPNIPEVRDIRCQLSPDIRTHPRK